SLAPADTPPMTSRPESLGTLVLSSTAPAAAESPSIDPIAKERARKEARRLRQALALTIIMLVIFLFAAITIVRFSRRYRRYLGTRKSPPTPNADVWSMHKVPESLDPSAAEDDPDAPDPDENEPRNLN